MSRYLALDLGAESGRAVIGHLEDDRLRLEEIHRFPNGPVRLADSLHWDVLRLWSEIKQALGLAAKEHSAGLRSVGLDTWGVDFGLLDDSDVLLANPWHYRDRRTEGMMDAAFRSVPRAEIYRRTGIQFMPINSLYQLLAMARTHSPLLSVAQHLLMMPDLFHFWLSGHKCNEFTIATTSQCYDPRRRDWAGDLLDRLDIPGRIFGEVVAPGTVLGPLLPALAEETGSPRIPVVAVASHDTGSAVAAVPTASSDFFYLSSGTWSLLGVELPEPIIDDHTLASDLTNEGGVGGTFRLLKNIMGLWLVQESRREWARAGSAYSYDDLTRMAAAAPAFGSFILPTDGRFLAPGDMPGRIQAFCRDTGQSVPETPGQIVRTVLESLALEYRRVAEQLDETVGRRLPVVHIIGGGSRNRLLNQFTADATGRTVIAGPVEATAIGNVLVQALAIGELPSLAAGRDLVRRSFDLETYGPGDTAAWDEAYRRFRAIGAGRGQ